MRQFLAILLSLCLGLFLADAVVSLMDDSLILFFGIHALAGLRGVMAFFTLFTAVVIYALMGMTPMIPKRFFLPMALFTPAVAVLAVPFLIYFYGGMQRVAWMSSVCQVILGLTLLYCLRGGLKLQWPLISAEQLGARRFSWVNLSVFLLVNLFVLLPGLALYFAFSAALAVRHFSEGFVALRPSGVTVQVRKYVRNDGQTIQLVPMSHVGEPEFYRALSKSFPTNSMILMEGVTDNTHLLTNRITYKRMATSLGLASQEKEFKPSQIEMVRADVDVDEFTPGTIDFLNMVMLIHAKGVNAENVLKLLQYSPAPGFEGQLFNDLLRKRNRHLLKELDERLPESKHIIVPWGAAHMPEIAERIQKLGFRLDETHEYVAIRFHFVPRPDGTQTRP